MMPKVPDPETASGRSSASTLGTERAVKPEPTRLAMHLAGSPLATQTITHLISKAPTATSASSGGPTHEKARVFWPL